MVEPRSVILFDKGLNMGPPKLQLSSCTALITILLCFLYSQPWSVLAWFQKHLEIMRLKGHFPPISFEMSAKISTRCFRWKPHGSKWPLTFFWWENQDNHTVPRDKASSRPNRFLGNYKGPIDARKELDEEMGFHQKNLPASGSHCPARRCHHLCNYLPAWTILGLSRGEVLIDGAVHAFFCFMAWSISANFSLSAKEEAETVFKGPRTGSKNPVRQGIEYEL